MLGELDGVGQEVQHDLAQPAGVAHERARQAVLGGVHELEALLRRERGDVSSAPSMHGPRANGSASRSILPASILEKSRMSLMIVRSASPEVAIVSA